MRVVGQQRQPHLHAGLQLAQRREHLQDVGLHRRVVDAVPEEQVAELRVGEHGGLGAQDLLDPVRGVAGRVRLGRVP
jgi:hypothetical protein